MKLLALTGHMAMANSHVTCACARQMYFTGCTENLLDAWEIYWMHGKIYWMHGKIYWMHG